MESPVCEKSCHCQKCSLTHIAVPVSKYVKLLGTDIITKLVATFLVLLLTYIRYLNTDTQEHCFGSEFTGLLDPDPGEKFVK